VIGAGKTKTNKISASNNNALATHYAGYEAAVYAATTNYIQGNSQTKGNWMQKNNGNKGLKYWVVLLYLK
jgi:hypothetical protein